MTDPAFNVLFLCTGNTARSIMAEGILRKLGAGRFNAFSAGSQPKGMVNPYAIKSLKTFDCPTDGYRSKSWEEFATPDAPKMDFVFTVCDNAAGEACPIWPGRPMTAHWGVEDPVGVEGTDIEKQHAFNDAFCQLYRRISVFAALPLKTAEGSALATRLEEIGRMERSTPCPEKATQ